MEFFGKVHDVALDFVSGNYIISFEAEQINEQELEALRYLDKLKVKANKYRQKRSLDANALLWACIGDISKALGADKWNIYLLMLKRYGRFTYICVKPNMVDAVRAQWRESEIVGNMKINGQDAVQMLCYFGSSTYNTKEFSLLLDGVISEMEEMGLKRPLPPDVKGALDNWEKSCGKK